ncbi:hypothetical protein IE53DRAFT_69447 [Violaceomyces palustris]|uniref:Uncharacterized protein n=1 Tax=Violaceomyces palustris TaxID=1673888 RepID=A0ACD0NYX3_9BASI|nr:hypothetical protein IE53DRAFT_69447 [Violaceomyces palustris]
MASGDREASPANAAAVAHAPMTLETLKSKVSLAKAERTSLRAQLENLKSLPEPGAVEPVERDLVSQELSRELATLEERSILYRICGWTCFEVDLDVGSRARAERLELAKDEEHAKAQNTGIGIRIETFWRGRFFEPYYLVFGSTQQILDIPAIRDGLVSESHLKASSHDIRLLRHTIPHFVPLKELVDKYLYKSTPHSLGVTDDKFGLKMVERLKRLPGLNAFLSQLHTYLQAFVSRRQQALSLRDLALPDRRLPSDGNGIEASGSVAFDQIQIRWSLPRSSTRQEGADAGPPNVDGSSPRRASKRRRGDDGEGFGADDNRADEKSLHQVIEVQIQWDDLRVDRISDRPPNPLDGASSELEQTEEAKEKDYTSAPSGRVKVEQITMPEPSSRFGRKTNSNVGDSAAFEERRSRRPDLEAIFSRSRATDAGEDCLELDDALAEIASKLWTEELSKSTKDQIP